MLLSAGVMERIHGIELAVGRAVLLAMNDIVPWVSKFFKVVLS